MATLSCVDTNGNSVVANITYENDNTSLKLVITMPNGKTKEFTKLYKKRLDMLAVLEKADIIIDNFYHTEYTE